MAMSRLRAHATAAIVLLSSLLMTHSSHAISGAAGALQHIDEVDLLAVIDAVASGELDTGIRRIEALLGRNPRFKVAHMVYADLLLARAGRVRDPIDGDARLAGLREEIAARVRHANTLPISNQVPASLLMLSSARQNAIVVDVSAARLYLVEREAGRFRVVSDSYVSTGKKGPLKLREGDQRTPLGVYFITAQIASETLSDFYGPGALPINYPNEWDLRLGRTGYGIWVHGVPSDTYSRVPRASDGCMALPNVAMQGLLRDAGETSTPVIIADAVEWIEPRELERRRDEFLIRFRSWKKDWESLNFQMYARHYSSEFYNGQFRHESWLKHKRRVNASKTFIEVGASDISVFAYPGEESMMVVSFRQAYRSSNYSSTSLKRQYWRLEADGQWRVLYEGDARFLPVHLRGIPYSARSGIALQLR